MSWRPGVNISWRWIIRGTCLGLLGLCVGLWGLSYSYTAGVAYTSASLTSVSAAIQQGTAVLAEDSSGLGTQGWGAHWDAWDPWYAALNGNPHALGRHFMGFIADHYGTEWYVTVPFWCPSILLALASLAAWRKVFHRTPARGFPVEPLASRRENAGG